MKNIAIYCMIFCAFLLYSCDSSQRKEFAMNPVDETIKRLDKEKTYSIILYDMDVDDDDHFKHKYKIITNLTDSAKRKEEITDWEEVDKDYFVKNQDNLGMELASKSEDGKVHKTPAPPGYSNYVGNEKYGQWKTDNNGNSFWAFYGQYMFMSSMFNLMAGPVYRNNYDVYRRDYYGRQPYYGNNPDGSSQYGTNSKSAKSTNPTFFDRNKNNTNAFKSKVQNSVTRSNQRVKSNSSSSSSSSSSKSRSSSSSSKSRSSGGRRR